MPTGYTAGVQDGTITDFRTFALRCARAFGVAITMRDDPADAPLPERFEPDTSYHDTQLTRARHALATLPTLADADCEARAAAEHDAAVARWNERRIGRDIEERRYRAMLTQVEAWPAPTTHAEMKRWMAKQLQESIEFDCRSETETPTKRTGAAWRDAQLAEARRDVEYHARQREEAIARTEERNRWLADLRASLPTSMTPTLGAR